MGSRVPHLFNPTLTTGQMNFSLSIRLHQNRCRLGGACAHPYLGHTRSHGGKMTGSWDLPGFEVIWWYGGQDFLIRTTPVLTSVLLIQ